MKPTKKCEHIKDRSFVVDDTGVSCDWKEVNYETGCCPQTGSDSVFSCTMCTDNCCTTYAYCVSCCLFPSNPQLVTHPNDKFSYCIDVCRLTSSSVVNEQKWKSGMKYCFLGTQFAQNNNYTENGKQDNDTIITFPRSRGDHVLDGKVIPKSPEEKTLEIAGEKPSNSDEIGLSTVSEITKVQKEQDNLLMQLEGEMKRLIQQIQILVAENKVLTTEIATLKESKEEVKEEVKEVKEEVKEVKDEEAQTEEKGIIKCSAMRTQSFYSLLFLVLSIHIWC